MINIWLALSEDAEQELQSWLSAETLTDDQVMVKDAILSHPDIEHITQHTKRMTDGATGWGLYSMYVGESPTVLSNLDSWLTLYAGKAFVVGAWQWNGLQLGTADGGVPTYPIDSRVLQFMPDDVVYGEAGTEVGRIAATELKQINLMAGQKPRLFT
jgi:hypothetical protein